MKVANDNTLMPGLELRISAGFPLEAGGEAGTTPAAQARTLDFVERRARTADSAGQALAPRSHVRGVEAIARRSRPRSQQGFARLEVGIEQDVGAPDVVFDLEISRRPFGKRHLVADQLGDFVDALLGHAANGVVIDHHARALVAQAGAGRLADADQAILGDLAAFDPQVVAQAFHHCPVALHAVGNVVRKQHPIFAARLGINE